MVYGINQEIPIRVTLVFIVQVMDMTGKYIRAVHFETYILVSRHQMTEIQVGEETSLN